MTQTPLFSGEDGNLPGKLGGIVTAVSASARHGFSKQVQPAIHLLAGLGVRGDAHCGATVQHLYLKRRNPTAPNRMQVHLLGAELLEEMNAKGFRVSAGDLGENVLTRGIDLIHLPAGTRVFLGKQAIVELTCLRQPCKQIDNFQPGLQKQMIVQGEGQHNSRARVSYRVGVMGIVLCGGTVMGGDEVGVELPRLPHRPLRT